MQEDNLINDFFNFAFILKIKPQKYSLIFSTLFMLKN